MKQSTVTIIALATNLLSCASLQASSQLTLAGAKRIAKGAETCAAQRKWNISVAIVNSEGNLLYFQRGDRSYAGSEASALQKAKSANAFQRPTSAFVETVRNGKVGILSGTGIVAIEGGVPILRDGEHIGAIGISGAKATEDEECAVAALANAQEK